MAQLELPIEELQPLVMSMKRVFAPFIEAIPSIVKIPQEVERLTDTIKQDVKSGQPERFVSGSKKSKDSVDMIGMMRTYIDSNSDEGKKRKKELEDLERIAQERQKAEADLEKVLQTGTPAEITETNEVKILNEKEIIEKQKELLKTQSDSTFIEEKIAEEKLKGEDADSDELVRLQEALENNNTLLQEQTQTLGDRLPREKVPETVGARDFIPAPLMEAYDNIAETARESAGAIGSIFQPLIGLKKLFTTKKEYEEDALADKESQDNKLGLSVIVTTLKFIGLTVAVFALLKAIQAIVKYVQNNILDPMGINQVKADATKKALAEGKGDIEANFIGEQAATDALIKGNKTAFDSAYNQDKIGPSFEFDIANDMLKDKMDEKDRKKFLDDTLKQQNKTLTNIGLLGGSFLDREPVAKTVNIVQENKSETAIVGKDTPIKGDTPFEINVIGSEF